MDKKVIFSIDVDMINYLDHGSKFYNELAIFYPIFYERIFKNFSVKTSWFLRIDSQVEKHFGSADFCFTKNPEIIRQLTNNKGEIGWHHHSYKFENNEWAQETNEDIVTSEINKYGEIARRHKLEVCRMGWGFQTNMTLKALDELNFIIDSSSIPRPKYKWDISVMDWHNASTIPYYPSINNYKHSTENNLSILEIPITTSLLKADYDTENVIRYLNPAYHHQKFVEAFKNVENKSFLCMIMHPYEVMLNDNKHNLLSFSIDDLARNVEFLLKENYSFISYADYHKDKS